MLEMIIACSVLGIVAGVLAGMLGIGGGVVIVPALVIILTSQAFPAEFVVISAVATSLCTIIFTSISAARAQIKRKAVDWTIFKRWALLVVIGSFVSGFIAGRLPPVVLEMGIACFLLIVSIIMLSRWVPNPSRSMPGPVGTSFLGLFSGTLSGLAGIGGGNVMVPLMVFFNVPMQRAVATSSALGLPLALVGTIGYVISGWGTQITEWSLGYVYLPAAALIAGFTVITAPLGVALSHRIPAPTLKRCFGALLFLVAARMLVTSF
ncbi:sulfite exporter TauE/SafE family protein [Marinobacter nanhaiticus D15-8W]|uniref:sulfite exporter TauE/SafE family protein n=1 Tax=Marinobacter nanhaiticus TaxID=1305740 RepID=UPI0002CA6595|nr:sulfite exporter TauE/SafE family protein [Marinobacter nanhaiticus]BES73827.1 sulfite exporter TauE/SafE family protein [Marinobacter nanhaiticus D15-8W]